MAISMNRIVPTILSSILFVLYSCSTNFLENNGQIEAQLKDTLILTNDRSYDNLAIDLRIAGNAKYSITKFPNWMVFNSFEGFLKKGSAVLTFTTRNIQATLQYGTYLGQLEFTIEKYGIIRKIIRYENNGFPGINVSTALLDAGLTAEMEFTINNPAEGRLFWKLDQAPNWVSFSKAEGILLKNEMATIKTRFNRNGLLSGTYIESFSILNNSTSEPIKVFIRMDVAN